MLPWIKVSAKCNVFSAATWVVVCLTPSVCFCAGIDLIASFYGCLYAGCVPVTVRPPHPQNLAATLPTVRMIIDVSSAFPIFSVYRDWLFCISNLDIYHMR